MANENCLQNPPNTALNNITEQNLLQLETPYEVVHASVSGQSKSLNLMTGSGFKKMMDKALAELAEQYPEVSYDYKPNSISINRKIIEEGRGMVTVQIEVRRKQRVEETFKTMVFAAELDDVDIQFASLYEFSDVDHEEYLKSICIARAASRFKAIMLAEPERDIQLKKIVVTYHSSSRYAIETTYTKLP